MARPLNLAAGAQITHGAQTQEIRYFPEDFDIAFFKKPHKWTEELRMGQRKGYSTDQCGTETPQPTNQLKMAELSCLSFSLAEISIPKNFVILFYEIKLLFTYFTLQ